MRKIVFTVPILLEGLIALGMDETVPGDVSEACLKALQLIRSAQHSEAAKSERVEKEAESKRLIKESIRLKRPPVDQRALRIKQLTAMINQYEPVAQQQEALGFKTTREKVAEWQEELKRLDGDGATS